MQTAKRLIADGVIGKPLFATTQMQWQGPELFHPNPAFLYAKGAGPLLDMGPYYVSALLHLLGPVKSVAAAGLKGKEKRVVQEGPQAGTEFPVEVPSTVMALMSFEEGGSAESLYSTDCPLLRHGVVELHGTEGTLVLPDPNTFGGDIQVIKPLERMFIPPEPTVQEVRDVEMRGVMSGRGLGALDLLRAVRGDRDHVANGNSASTCSTCCWPSRNLWSWGSLCGWSRTRGRSGRSRRISTPLLQPGNTPPMGWWF